MNHEEKREQRLRLLEDDIGRKLAESERSGELRRAAGYGKPLNLGDGYEQTPDELRMAMKILKDAGVVPPEVEAMQEIATLQAALTAELALHGDAEGARGLRQRISDKQQALALRLERLRGTGSL
jgi:hypothetical protein